MNHQEYRKAEDILRQLPRIGHPDYELKLYLLLAEAYQGQRPLGKARRLALASLCKWRALHHKTYPRWGRSADLHIAFITALGNNLEANALRKVHRPRRSYTAAFVGLAMKVGAMVNPLSCSMILRRSLSILEHTQQWFPNLKLLSLLVRTVFPEKPLAAGKTRVRWTCVSSPPISN